MKWRTEPVKGFDVAIPVALRHGRVMHFRSSPSYVGEFLFYGNGLIVLVSLRLVRRLFHATPARISEEYADAIAGLCTVPCGGPVSRELWLYSRYGALRLFRVGVDGSPEENDRDGMPFVDGKPVVLSQPAVGDAEALEPVPVVGVPDGSGSTDPESRSIRWLKKGMPRKNPVMTGPAQPVRRNREKSRMPGAGDRLHTPCLGNLDPPLPLPLKMLGVGQGGLESTEADSASDYPFFWHK
ncbi:MAG: hypothetical protein WC379_12140 [Methanoregula sp.]|jgi:hypothetical protein